MAADVLLVVAIVAAVWVAVARRRRVAGLRRAARTGPGSSPEQALRVTSYTEVDDHLARRWCGACGGYLERLGEGSRTVGSRQLRIARLCCQECERVAEVFFDTTDVRH